MRIPILLGKTVSSASRIAKRSGSTWPGHLAIKIDPEIIVKILKNNPHLQIIFVAGTNGKTTTSKLIQEVLETEGYRVFRNATGANLLNGIASTLIKHANHTGKIYYDAAVFEVDENTLPQVIQQLSKSINPISIILLNLFRDQLDRYGEVNSIAKKWLTSLKALNHKTVLVTNGDDPMLAYIGEHSGLSTSYFGLPEKYMKKKNAPHDVDFLYCPKCASPLVYSKRSYSHMGIFKCTKCKFAHQNTFTFDSFPNPMFGLYNRYNINAAILALEKAFAIRPHRINNTLTDFAPAFGRQEVINYKGHKIFMLLSKNPTGFNQSIDAILEQSKNPNVLLLLNDRIPDGRDVSWIWDVDFEKLNSSKRITVAGDRAYDMALRIKYTDYASAKTQVHESLDKSIKSALSTLKSHETLYVLTTYSAMLDARKILKGRSIL